MSRRFVDSTGIPESISRTRPPRYSDLYTAGGGARDKQQPMREPSNRQHNPSPKGGSRTSHQQTPGPKQGPRSKELRNPKSPMETVNVELETYDVETQRWGRERSIIHFSTQSFAHGGMRDAYKAWNCKVEDWESFPMVLKMPISADLQNEKLVRTQVVMQAKCARYATQFNAERKTSKEISYVPCRLVKFLSGKWKDRFGCLEDYMAGNFVKHNTVNPDYDGVAMTTRNTPQAYSHYTFEKSGKTEIVVDVQGVGDTYTDPQLYSVSVNSKAPPYGPADWAIMGVANFFKNHQCNDICLALGLTPNRMKPGTGQQDHGPTGGRRLGTRPRQYRD